MLQAAGAIGEEIAYAFAEAGATAIAFAGINEQKAKTIAEKSQDLAVNQELPYDRLCCGYHQSLERAAIGRFGGQRSWAHRPLC